MTFHPRRCIISIGQTLTYTLDGTACGLKYGGNAYYFYKNLQGDVIAITDNAGTVIARYTYDAWGVPEVKFDSSSCQIATINPFRYRGYYYDEEIGLYYLQSRYYDASVGRFINCDDPMLIGLSIASISYNLTHYCENNPVNRTDVTGYIVTPANVIGAIIGVILGIVGGYFLSRFLADKIGLRGWKRTAFIIGITAIISASAAVIGYFIGPYVAKAFNAMLNGLRGLFKPSYGTKLGKIGTITRNTKPTIKGLTQHGIQRLSERGMSKALAQKIVTKGYAVAQNSGKVLYFTKEGVVVLNAAGQIVTAYTSQYFDETMQAIVKLFFK